MRQLTDFWKRSRYSCAFALAAGVPLRIVAMAATTSVGPKASKEELLTMMGNVAGCRKPQRPRSKAMPWYA